MVRQGALKPEADSKIPFAIKGKSIFRNRGFDWSNKGKWALVWIDIPVVAGNGPLTVSKRKLDASTEFWGFRFGREKFPSFKLIITIKPPYPDVRIVEKIVSQEKSINTVCKLQGIAGIDTVKPHQRSQEGGRSEVYFLQPQSGFEPG